MTLNNKDNTIRTASNLGTLSSSLSRKGLVGRKDKVDFFKFSLSTRSSFSATLTGLKNNVDIALRSGSGQVIAQSLKPGKQAETISAALNPGVFYLQVIARTSRSSSPYQLNLSATAQLTNGGNGGSNGNGSSGSSGGTTTRLVKIPTLDEPAFSFIPSGDSVFLFSYTKDGSSLILSAYRNGSLKQLGSGISSNSQTEIYGNRAVWSSLMSGVGYELFLYDGTTTQQLTNSVSDTPRLLGIDGSRVFWLNEQSGGKNQLYVYDGTQNVLLGTNVDVRSQYETTVFRGGFQQNGSYKDPSFISAPVNTSLIWSASGGSDGGSDTELFLFNGDTGKVVQLTANDTSNDRLKSVVSTLTRGANNPLSSYAFSNNNVVFTDDDKLNLYDGSTGKTVPLSPSGSNAFAYSMSGDNVLFKNNNGTFIFNGSSIKEVPISDQSTQVLSFSGSNLVLRKADGVTDTELFFYNGTTGQTTQLTQRPGIDPPNLSNELLLYQDGTNVFWVDSGKIYISNGNTGDRRQLADSIFNGEFTFINSNLLWQKEGFLFFYNSSTGQTNKLNDDLSKSLGIPKTSWLSSSSIGWESNGKTFLYNIDTNTTSQLTGEGYSFGAINGSNALVSRSSDGAYFYTA